MLERAGVVGAGTMGIGIALCFANAGIDVTLVDTSEAALARAATSIAQTYATAVARGRMTQTLADECEARIHRSERVSDLAAVDIAIEAVYEDLAMKRAVFSGLGSVLRADAVLASNTSTLDIDAIAAAASHPERTLGMHFFSPAHVMKLVEVVRGRATSGATIDAAVRLSERLGKLPVVVGNGDGFVGNRMLLGYRREAEFMLLAGATPERIDDALRAFGFAMGVFAVSDLAGIDVGYQAKHERIKRGAAPRFVVSDLPDALVGAGRLGQKVGRGYYRYDPGDRTPYPDRAIEPLVAAERARLGITTLSFSDEVIVERCVYALVNEGAHLLHEGIAARAADIDTIWVNGYGFPKARGGPMRYAQDVGLGAVLARIRGFAATDPLFWRISPALEDAALTGRFS